MPYIIRRTSDKLNGCTVVMHGKTADKLVKGLLNDSTGEVGEFPISPDEIKKACVMNYKNDAGKQIFTQEGDSVLTPLKDGRVFGVHNVKTGKSGEAVKNYVVWTKNGDKMFPKYRLPVNEEVIAAIKALK